jgi:ABC-2 type transport system ATP-binding protein
LYKQYGELRVLEGVDLEVGHGEVFALLGPNGAGKTTTVEILEGYRRATAGQVRVLGFDPWTHPRPLQERTGVVLQECGFPNHLRVGEVIDAWRAYYPRPRPMSELLELVELTDQRSTLVRRLSGGQRRRLDFALALAGDPEVIFLDEPTTGFDPEARRRCWTAIDNLRTLGKTILLTTHYLDEAERLADRVAILAAGRIRAVGTPHQLSQLAAAPTSISFTAPCFETGRLPALLTELEASRDGNRVTLRSRAPSSVLQALLNCFGELPDLAVAPPTLEDTYLQIVADDQAAKR